VSNYHTPEQQITEGMVWVIDWAEQLQPSKESQKSRFCHVRASLHACAREIEGSSDAAMFFGHSLMGYALFRKTRSEGRSASIFFDQSVKGPKLSRIQLVFMMLGHSYLVHSSCVAE
jgi:hypothetical protein